uniref:Putative secreted protein n=1 Tax=Rhipicephalus microplus TaxID=6941 RepID=A0A6G5A4E7_RHIMP
MTNTNIINGRLSNVVLLLSSPFAFALCWPWHAILFTSVYTARSSSLAAPTCISRDLKNATSHRLWGSVSHCWQNLAQRQEEYFKKSCMNITHQS